MASEAAIVKRRAEAREALAAAEARIATVCGVSVDVEPRSPDAEIANIQQIERVTALLTLIADQQEGPSVPAEPEPEPEPDTAAPPSARKSTDTAESRGRERKR